MSDSTGWNWGRDAVKRADEELAKLRAALTAAESALAEARKALLFANSLIHGRPNDWPGEHKAAIDAAIEGRLTALRSGSVVLVPKEVLEFYRFADMVFVPFTSQQEQLYLSLDKARRAMLAGVKR